METKSQPLILKKVFTLPLYWWVILLGLVAWSIWAVWPQQQAGAEITYSDFLDQVRAGNVSQVTFAGGDITGIFVNPLQAPLRQTAPSDGAFHTRFPEVIGDDNLISLLESHNVQINVKPAATPLESLLSSSALPLSLLVIVLVLTAIKINPGRFGNPLALKSGSQRYVIDHPQVTFKDIAGEEEAKTNLQEIVDYLRYPEKYQKLGARVPKAILLVGQPGTGKTWLAHAVAGEARVPLISLTAPVLANMSPSRIKDLIKRAQGISPSVIFIDELDAVSNLAGERATKNNGIEQPLSQFLTELNASQSDSAVIILAATRQLDKLDPNLCRSGYFDRQIRMSLPNREGREEILKIHTRGMRLAKNVNLGIVARTATGFSGADLAKLCNEAALIAARKDQDQVNMADFEEAFDHILIGAKRNLLMNEQDRRVVAYHEAGHALIAWLTPAADPISQITIIPHERSSALAEPLTGDDHHSYNRPSLLALLAVMLGGRGAEEVVMGEITTAAENDLVDATRLARRMVTRWGMGHMGFLALETGNDQALAGRDASQSINYSEKTAAQVDQEIQELLSTCYTGVCKMISASKTQLDRLAEALLKDETLNKAEIARILGPRPLPEETDFAIESNNLDQKPSRES